MADWLGPLTAMVARDGRAVRVTIAQATGSTPREAGTTMIVGARECHGTIGGGHLEFEAIRIARDAIANAMPAGAWLVRFPLAARLGQCCGGVATIAFAAVERSACDWLETAAAAQRDALPVALVTRVGGAGDTSATIVVTATAATGSLGAPDLDATAMATARARLAAGEAGAWVAASPAGDNPSGENTTLITHVVVPTDFDVLVFGNGHVGRALVQVLAALPARVRWIDNRDVDFPATVPDNVEIIATDTPETEIAAAWPGSYVIVTTHSHTLDFDIVAAALARDDWRYVGLIGSKSKRNQFEKRMAARGIAPEVFARVTCPIGVSDGLAIRSKEPGAIAVAVAAELLVLREKRVRPFYLSAPAGFNTAQPTNKRV